MVPLIGGMNSEPRRLTAKVAARLIWQRPVSSKYPRYLLGAACIKQNSISKIHQYLRFGRNFGRYQPQPFFQFPAHLPANIIAMRSGSSLRDGFASFFNNPTDSVTCLSRERRGLKNLWIQGSLGEASVREEGRKRALGRH
jgi:hypothetical protein